MFKKKKKIELKIPKHIAFIMDGNRRWAKTRGLNKMLGHKQGAVAMRNLVLDMEKIDGLEMVSFFAFSTENWNREQREIDYLFDLIKTFVDENQETYKNHNIKFVVIGDVSKFPQDMQEILQRAEKETQSNTGLVVNMALNYGGRADIVHATKKLLESGKELTEESLKENLYCQQDIDLLIRTSGEQRISNFMLYQMAYAELYFTKVFWPDFDKKQLYKAIEEFSLRNRRFGGK